MINLEKKIKDHALQAEAVWSKSYPYFDKIIQKEKLKVGAEIGVAFGGHCESLLSMNCIKKIYGVDPYKHDFNYVDAMNMPQDEFDELYKFTTGRLSVFGEKYTHIRKSGLDAVCIIPEILDFVYIDGDHSYEGVKKDFKIWYNKVRIGGIVGGHDYNHIDLPGVMRAIDECCYSLELKINVESETVWWIKK